MHTKIRTWKNILGSMESNQLTGQEQTGGGLGLPGGDGATLVLVGKKASLGTDALKDIVHEGVHDRHVFEGNTA